MPILDRSSYSAPHWLRHGHLQTVYPVLFRRGPRVCYQRQRVETPDGDFLDLDWSRVGGRRVGLIVHGIESSAQEPGIRAMAAAFNRRSWDAVVLNLRGCSGEPNRLPRAYHGGATEDVASAVGAIIEKNHYDAIGMVGFSLGGNLVLKYLGESGSRLPAPVFAAAAVSVPCDLTSCIQRIMEPTNRLYMLRMLWSLKKKLRHKQSQPSWGDGFESMQRIKTIADFDERVTAVLHGFGSASDYWSRSSCKPWLSQITRPTLLINAQDDPLLAKACYPFEEASQSNQLTLETPRWGGHLGFVRFGRQRQYWHETRIISFLEAMSQPR